MRRQDLLSPLLKENPEYLQRYADEFLASMVCTQIRVLRRQRGLSQGDLARRIGTTRAAISRLENGKDSSWDIPTLKRIAEALQVRLHISFETFDSLDVSALKKEALERALPFNPYNQHEETAGDESEEVTDR